MTVSIERLENEDDDYPEWGEWWPEALEKRELDNADAEVPSPLKPLFQSEPRHLAEFFFEIR